MSAGDGTDGYMEDMARVETGFWLVEHSAETDYAVEVLWAMAAIPKRGDVERLSDGELMAIGEIRTRLRLMYEHAVDSASMSVISASRWRLGDVEHVVRRTVREWFESAFEEAHGGSREG